MWDVDGHEWVAAGAASAEIFLAVLLLRAGAGRAQNTWFAAVLAAEALLTIGAWGPGLTTSRTLALAGASLFAVGLAVITPLYLGFLSTLETRLASPLRTPAGRAAPWAFTGLVLTLLAVQPAAFLAAPQPNAHDAWALRFGPWFTPAFQTPLLAVSLFALVAALHLWRSTPVGSARRARGAWFALAFGVRDSLQVLFIGVHAAAHTTGNTEHPLVWASTYVLLPLVALVFVAIAGLAILRHQMFDLELRIRHGLEGTLVAGAIAAAFFVGSELVEAAVNADGTLAGLVAAAALALAFRPLHRLAHRLAGRLLPGVEDTDAYLSARRREVYRAAFESAAADGRMTDRERTILDTLRASLALSPEEADRIEREPPVAGVTHAAPRRPQSP